MEEELLLQHQSRRTVRPSSRKCSGEEMVALSTCDLAIPNVYAMAIYAFKAPATGIARSSASDFVEDLERGLAKALDEYPEWAGRLCRDESSSSLSSSANNNNKNNKNKMSVHLNHDGVALIEASMNCCLQDLMPFDPCPRLFQLVPATQSVEELLLIQVTSFSCGGVVLGVAWHHRLADGQAFFSFMDNWARLTRGAPLASSPFHDRAALTAREVTQPLTDDYMTLAPTIPPPTTTEVEADDHHHSLSAKKLHFSTELLHKIKSRASGSDDEALTTFESLTAHLWKCITKARELSGEVKTQIMIPMNGRSRLSPPLPESYFGNATFMPSSGTEVEQLVKQPLSFAAQLVHSAIAKADNDYLRSAIDLMEVRNRMVMMMSDELVQVSVPPSMSPHVVVTSWVRFPLYEVDFGWGEPFYVGNVLDLFEGIMILLPSYTRDGSIDAVVALFQPEIEKLEELCFSDGDDT